MDIYLLSRILKPYVKKALVICGDLHRLALDKYLGDLGYTLQSQNSFFTRFLN
jgi:hypothetical protein